MKKFSALVFGILSVGIFYTNSASAQSRIDIDIRIGNPNPPVVLVPPPRPVIVVQEPAFTCVAQTIFINGVPTTVYSQNCVQTFVYGNAMIIQPGSGPRFFTSLTPCQIVTPTGVFFTTGCFTSIWNNYRIYEFSWREREERRREEHFEERRQEEHFEERRREDRFEERRHEDRYYEERRRREEQRHGVGGWRGDLGTPDVIAAEATEDSSTN